MVHTGAPLLLLLLIRKWHRILPVPAQNYFQYCFSGVVFFVFKKQEYLNNLTRSKLFHPLYHLNISGSYRLTLNLKIIKEDLKIGSCRSSFGPSFLNWEIKRPYQFLLQIILNIAYAEKYKKNIWNV